MENFRIESLNIRNIGVFKHLQINFPKKNNPEKAEIHIITGANGSGKSTILEILTNSKLDNSITLFKKFHKIVDDKIYSDYTIFFSGPQFINHFGDKNGIDISRTVRSKKIDDFSQKVILYPNSVFDFSMFAYSGVRRIVSDGKIELKNYEENPLNNALNIYNSINNNSFVQWIAYTKSKQAFAFQAGKMKDSKIFAGAIKIIEDTLEEITEEKIEFVIQYETDLRVDVNYNGNILPLYVLAEGVQSMISWIGDLLMRMDRIKWKDDLPIFDRNFILFLDEIEVHLHPAWQRKILPVVQKLFKNAQIFISTHSPFVVGSVDGAWVHKLKKDGAYAVLDGEPVLSEDAESYETILEEIFGIKERFGDEIELKLREFREITKEILQGEDLRIEEWDNLVSFFENQGRPDEIMALITPQVRQINRIKNQVIA